MVATLMQGSSRGSLAGAFKQLDAAASSKGVDAMALADELFAITAALDSSATLRRALTDSGRDPAARGTLVTSLFGGRYSATAVDLAKQLVAARWSSSGDLADAFEALAVAAVVISADAAGKLGALEDELFRFERTILGSPDLREAFADHRGDGVPKADLVEQLLAGKATDQTIRLARQAVLAARGRRIGASLETYLAAAAARRQQSVAHATVAAPLSAAHQDRLQAALSKLFGREVQLNIDVDPTIIGGIRVEVGDEVVDGSILGRLEEAQRRLAG
jgi:F-type H+-transporting ATPase subunit delta